MILLPNGCSCSEPSVNPKNWKTITASVKSDWYIQYYFRDPQEIERYPYGKLVIVKGMNSFKLLAERVEVTKQIIKNELDNLHSGFNPIKGIYQHGADSELSPFTPFMQALNNVCDRLKCAHTTKLDIKSTLKFVGISAERLGFQSVPMINIRRKHIKQILESCEVSNNTYNAYRKNLSILFKELLEYDAVDSNYLRDISKRKVVKKIRKILSPQECKKVSGWARDNDYRFYLLIHIFFHSGCRTTEIFRVKKKHVDLVAQTLLVTVMKGNQPFEVLKPIKDIALWFWQEAIAEAADDDYIFSIGLRPGSHQNNPRQAGRRWKRHVKNKLKIECDWYSLKHLNSDQVAESQGLDAASLLNSHKNLSTTRIYTIHQEQREMERLKKVNNRFA